MKRSLAAALVALAANAQSSSLTVHYTGRLMGYFRNPDRQAQSTGSCPDTQAQASPAASAFFHLLESRSVPLLLSTGDNFAPELNARALHPPGELPLPKDELALDNIHVDNVVCFMRQAGYAAATVGKHDFYFGAERLRHYARMLMNPREQGEPVRLLAANLAIASRVLGQAPPVPDYLSKRPYETSWDGLGIDIPATVLPWTHQFRIQSVNHDFTHAWLCPTTQPGDPDSVALPSTGKCAELKQSGDLLHIPWEFGATVPLPPDRSYAICVDLARPKNKPYYCARFSVHSPLLQYPINDAKLDPAAPEPYLTTTVEGRHVAVFGVVDPALRESIGLLNYTWIQTSKRPNRVDRETTVVVADPVRSLDQLLQRCGKDPACRDATKILLAQMSADAARLLNLRMGRKFDLVISQSDEGHATETETFTYQAAPNAGTRPLFVVSPRQLYSQASPDRVDVRIQKAAITVKRSGDTTRWELDHRYLSATVNVARPADNHTRLANWIDDAATAISPDALTWPVARRFERVTLNAMRAYFKADVALIQRRDLFQPAAEAQRPTDGASIQEALDRILWKGDFVVRLAVTGATLRTAVQRGRAFDTQDTSTFNTGLELARGLIAFGILDDRQQGALMVNGEPIEDGRLYSAAVTDYLAFGDTGYPELRNPAVPPPIHMRDLTQLAVLSDLVCQAIAQHTAARQPRCRPVKLDTLTYWDRIAHPPFDSRSGFTPLRRLAFWPEQGLLRRSPLEDNRTPGIDRWTQQRPIWSLTLDKAETGISLYGHNADSEAALAGKFAGVPIGQVTAPNSTTVTTAFRAVK